MRLRPAGHRLVKVGIVGLGQVGQAVARLAPSATRLHDSGLRFKVVGALVRDVDKPRRCARPRLTSNPAAFLRGNYDVVIEALGTIEPARSIVSRVLGRGVPVVTANKALVAAHGPELSSLAARRGTTFRYEASALAGVPFLGALAARPLVSDVQRFTAVVNGTSNFILSRLEREGHDFASALADAQALGLTEPDPSRDLDGRDAADKLSLLASLFGWGTLSRSRVDVQGIYDITPADLAIAAALGGTIKPIAHAAVTPSGVSAFIGPDGSPRVIRSQRCRARSPGFSFRGASSRTSTSADLGQGRTSPPRRSWTMRSRRSRARRKRQGRREGASVLRRRRQRRRRSGSCARSFQALSRMPQRSRRCFRGRISTCCT